MGQSDGATATTGQRDRGSVLLAAALMLAAVVVLAAAGLMLAPTSSDGVTGESVDERDIDIVEEGLATVFVESGDTLDPGYDPTFDPPAHEEPPPLNYTTVGTLLEPEPFTDEQVVQTQSLMASLASRPVGGTIASLDPVANATRTGVLVRLGTDTPHDFGRGQTTLVGNASAVRNLVVVFDRLSLPATSGNATTLQVGDWTVAAYHDRDAQQVVYQLGEYDPGGTWEQTVSGTDLRVDTDRDTVNGKPAPGGTLRVDPGDTPFDITVVDSRQGPPGLPGVRGGLNLVAVGADGDDTGAVDGNWQGVVTRPAFDVTYIDTTTTVTDRVAVTAQYRAFDEPDLNGSRPAPADVTLNVDTEDSDTLRDTDAGNVWLPQYTLEPNRTYGMNVTATLGNGTTQDWTRATTFSFLDDGENCTGDCVATSNGTNSSVTGTPRSLADRIEVRATVDLDEVSWGQSLGPGTNRTAGGDTLPGNGTLVLTRNVTVLDPYVETTLRYPDDTVPVGSSVGNSGTLELLPRDTDHSERAVPLSSPDISGFGSLPVSHIPEQIGADWNLDTTEKITNVTEAFARMRVLNSSERQSFRDGRGSRMLEILGMSNPHVADILSHFDSYGTFAPIKLDPADLLEGPRRIAGPNGEFGEPSALGVLFRGLSDVSVEAAQRFGSTRDTLENLPENADGEIGVPADRLLDLSENQTILYPVVAAGLAERVGWTDTTHRQQTLNITVEFADLLDSYTDSDETIYDLRYGGGRFDLAMQAIRDELKKQGRSFPGNLDNRVRNLLDRLAEFPGSDDEGFEPGPRGVGGTPELYFFLGGVDDPVVRGEMVSMLAAFQNGPERSSQALLEAADYTLLDQSRLVPSQSGRFELDTLDRLYSPWTVELEAVYDKYAFETYTARDTVTVTDPASGVTDIQVSVDYTDEAETLVAGVSDCDDPAGDCGTGNDPWQNNLGLTGAYPLLVGQGTPLQVEVTFENGTTVTNPSRGVVTYDLSLPALDPNPCDSLGSGWVGCPYTGPTDPDTFISVSPTAHAVTGTHPTGQIAVSANPGATPPTPTTGPVRLIATATGTNVSDSTDTSIARYEAAGELRWYEGTGASTQVDALDLYVPNYNPTNKTDREAWTARVRPGIRYTLSHVVSETARGVKDPFYAVQNESEHVWVQRDDYDDLSNLRIDGETASSSRLGRYEVDTTDSDRVRLAVDNGLDPSNFSKYDPPRPATVTGLDESAALGVSTLSRVDSRYDAAGRFNLIGDGSDGSPDPGGPVGEYNNFGVVASYTGTGRLGGNPVTSQLHVGPDVGNALTDAPEQPPTSAFSCADPRCDFAETKLSAYAVQEGETLDGTLYVFSNAEAVIEADLKGNPLELANGTVPWRDSSECSEPDNNSCLGEPTAAIDYVETTSEGWSSYLQFTGEPDDVSVNLTNRNLRSTDIGVAYEETTVGPHDWSDIQIDLAGDGDAADNGSFTATMVFRAGHPDLGISPKSTAASLELDLTAKNDSDNGGNPGNGSLSIVDARFPTKMNTGETAPVEIDIKNNGKSTETITVDWLATQKSDNGSYSGSNQGITVSSGQTKTVRFDFTPTTGETGTWEHTVTTLGEDRTGTTNVSGTASFNVASVVPRNGAPVVGEPFVTDITVENIGNSEGMTEITFEVRQQGSRAPSYKKSKSIILDSGQSKTVAFNFTPSSSALYGLTGRADGDSRSISVFVVN